MNILQRKSSMKTWGSFFNLLVLALLLSFLNSTQVRVVYGFSSNPCLYGKVYPTFQRLSREKNTYEMISSGFSFDDGAQRLISLQKPLGLILEEREETGGCEVVEVVESGEYSAHRAGIQKGDFLLAVQNADVSSASLEYVMERISNAPKVVNLRFLLKENT